MNFSLRMNTKAHWWILKYIQVLLYIYVCMHIYKTNGNSFEFCIALSYLIAANFCWHRNCEWTVIYMQVLAIIFRVTTYRIIWQNVLQT